MSLDCDSVQRSPACDRKLSPKRSLAALRLSRLCSGMSGCSSAVRRRPRRVGRHRQFLQPGCTAVLMGQSGRVPRRERPPRRCSGCLSRKPYVSSPKPIKHAQPHLRQRLADAAGIQFYTRRCETHGTITGSVCTFCRPVDRRRSFKAEAFALFQIACRDHHAFDGCRSIFTFVATA